MFIMRKDTGNPFDHTDIKMVTETEALPDILEAFKDFLNASGFSIKELDYEYNSDCDCNSSDSSNDTETEE